MRNALGSLLPYLDMISVCVTAALVAASAGCSGADADAAGAPIGDGLPCDVIQVLQDRCWVCHGTKPTPGAPMSLASRSDLTAKAKSNPSITVGEMSVTRMKSATAPMPPSGVPPAAEVAAFEAWVTAGMPEGSCDGPIDDPFGGGTVCTSGKTWTFGTDVSDLMRQQMYPGQACIDCHSKQPPPDVPAVLLVAGTVYPTGHEPNDCYGIDGSAMPDVIVQVADSQANVYDLPVNATGNFLLLDGPFVPPYSAKVISSKGERVMATKQTSGDCNACHTETGGGAGSMAPGRIVAPW